MQDTTKNKNTHFGRIGEDIALSHLQNLGYRLIERNYRYGRNEVDLIMWDQRVLVFVEVKSRNSSKYGYPEQAVSVQKFRAIQYVAEAFLRKKAWKGQIRFDVVSVIFQPEQSVTVFKDFFI